MGRARLPSERGGRFSLQRHDLRNLRYLPRVTASGVIDTLLVGEGDSMTAPTAGGDHSWPTQIQSMLPGNYLVVNEGTAGHLSSSTDSQFWGLDFRLRNDSYRTNIYVLNIGTNDFINSVPLATTQANVTYNCLKAKRNGWRVAVGTVLPSDVITGANEDNRVSYNSWLVTNYASFSDVLIDKAARPEFSPANMVPGSPVCADGTHLNAAGDLIVAQMVAETVQALAPLSLTQPAGLTGCVAWFTPSADKVTLNGSLVSAIRDRTGLITAGAAQTDSAQQPTYTSSDSTTPWTIPTTTPTLYHPSITFAAGKSLVNTTQNIVTPGVARSVIAVAYSPGNTGGAYISFGRSSLYNSCQLKFKGEGNFRAYNDGSTIGRVDNAANSSVHWTHFKFSGSGNAFAITQSSYGGMTIVTAKDQTTESGSTGFVLGNDPLPEPWLGNIVDWLVFDHVLSAGELTQLTDYYLKRYGF